MDALADFVAVCVVAYLLATTRNLVDELKARVEAIELSRPKIFDLPNGKGGVALEAIAAVQHDVDGFNVWVYLKSGHGAAICLTWAEGVELEQAWREWSKG